MTPDSHVNRPLGSPPSLDKRHVDPLDTAVEAVEFCWRHSRLVRLVPYLNATVKVLLRIADLAGARTLATIIHRPHLNTTRDAHQDVGSIDNDHEGYGRPRYGVVVWLTEMRLLSKPAVGGETGVVGRGGATDPHGHAECSGVPIPAEHESVRSRGIQFTCGGGQTVKPRGLPPRYFTKCNR